MFGQRIKALRISHGMSQVEFGKLLSVTKQSVCNWENGNIQPSIDMLIKISQTFSVSSDYLLGLERERQLDVSGLTDKQISCIQFIVDDLKKEK